MIEILNLFIFCIILYFLDRYLKVDKWTIIPKNKTSYSESSMDKIWTKIDDSLKLQSPEVYSSLNAGANDSKIEKLRAVLGGIQIPESIIETYKCHDGQHEDMFLFYPGDYSLFHFMSIDEIIEARKKLMLEFLDNENKYEDASNKIVPFWKSGAWIPFATDLGGNYYLISYFDPEKTDQDFIIHLWAADDYTEDDSYETFAGFIDMFWGSLVSDQIKFVSVKQAPFYKFVAEYRYSPIEIKENYDVSVLFSTVLVMIKHAYPHLQLILDERRNITTSKLEYMLYPLGKDLLKHNYLFYTIGLGDNLCGFVVLRSEVQTQFLELAKNADVEVKAYF